MKTFVTSIGEKTTALCVEQLILMGFHVTILDKVEPWLDKYRRFIEEASELNEDVLRVDADVILNRKIIEAVKDLKVLMAQFRVFDLYKNDINIGQPVWYSAESLQIIKKHFDELGDKSRPEASAWRLEQINKLTYTSNEVVGMSSFFQSDEHIKRHEKHKIERKQIDDYNFHLAKQLRAL